MTTHRVYWPMVLEDLKNRVSNSQWEAWFSSLEMVNMSIGGKLILLSVPSKFNKEYLEKKFLTSLKTSINKYFPNVDNIEFQIKPISEIYATVLKPTPIFEIESDATKKNTLLNSIKTEIQTTKNLPSRYSKNEVKSEIVKSITDPSQTSNQYNANIHNLNPKFCFENYVTASFNELAVSVAKSVIKQPGTLYNPVFIHSATGLGKTHLLQAIGHKTLETYPNFQIRYTTAETFLNHYISSMQKGKANEFRSYYRDVDLLMIDDIQFIGGKTGTQEAFFHTFNELLQANKQIIITSDKTPKMLGGVEDRLISRFEWGMVVDLSEPTLEDRLAIIRAKVHEKRMAITDSQMLQIATSIQTNFRDIEGVLNKIEVYLNLNKGSFMPQESLDKILNPYLRMISAGLMHFSVKNSEFDEIFEKVSKQWGADPSDIITKKRDKSIVIARQATMYIMHRYCGMSMSTIGKALGGRDHTTIVHGCQKIEALMKSDLETQIKLRQALENLNIETGLF
jgi:chromosomal replication initiator protein